MPLLKYSCYFTIYSCLFECIFPFLFHWRACQNLNIACIIVSKPNQLYIFQVNQLFYFWCHYLQVPLYPSEIIVIGWIVSYQYTVYWILVSQNTLTTPLATSFSISYFKKFQISLIFLKFHVEPSYFLRTSKLSILLIILLSSTVLFFIWRWNGNRSRFEGEIKHHYWHQGIGR